MQYHLLVDSHRNPSDPRMEGATGLILPPWQGWRVLCYVSNSDNRQHFFSGSYSEPFFDEFFLFGLSLCVSDSTSVSIAAFSLLLDFLPRVASLVLGLSCVSDSTSVSIVAFFLLDFLPQVASLVLGLSCVSDFTSVPVVALLLLPRVESPIAAAFAVIASSTDDSPRERLLFLQDCTDTLLRGCPDILNSSPDFSPRALGSSLISHSLVIQYR